MHEISKLQLNSARIFFFQAFRKCFTTAKIRRIIGVFTLLHQNETTIWFLAKLNFVQGIPAAFYCSYKTSCSCFTLEIFVFQTCLLLLLFLNAKTIEDAFSRKVFAANLEKLIACKLFYSDLHCTSLGHSNVDIVVGSSSRCHGNKIRFTDMHQHDLVLPAPQEMVM